MEAFTTHTGRAVPLRRSNADTDQIIPAHWLKKVTRNGFEDGLFEAWRKDPEFVLNRPERQGATVLVAGPDFGTGSSREHAVWALQNYGFKAVISSRFADIFRGNSLKNGLLTVILPQETVEELWQLTEADPTAEITVDLQAREVRAEGITAPSNWTTTPAGGCSTAWTTSASPCRTRPTSPPTRPGAPPTSRRPCRSERPGGPRGRPPAHLRSAPAPTGRGRCGVFGSTPRDNSPQMTQSAHGTRWPTRAVRVPRCQVEAGPHPGGGSASAGGRQDAVGPAAARHHRCREARSRGCGKASGGTDEGPRRRPIPRSKVFLSPEFVAAQG